MIVAVDSTPLIGNLTGVGRYVDRLVDALLAEHARDNDAELVLTAFTTKRRLAPRRPGARSVCRPAVMRVMHRVWSRSELLPVELLSGRCDVFHATNFILPPVRKARGIVTIHDLSYLKHRDTVDSATLRYREIVPRSVRRASLVLTPTEAIAAEVREEYHLPADRVRATPLGVSPEWLTALSPTADQRRRLGLPPRYVLFVGTREPRKGFDWLERAHALAGSIGDTLPLIVAGPAGWGDVRLPKGAQAVGYLEDADLRSLTAGASALVMPSRYEGFGLPVLEAMATGTQVICTDVPALREVSGGLARLVPFGDDEALAHALTNLAEDLHEGRSARRSWAARWTWERTADHTWRAYQDALA